MELSKLMSTLVAEAILKEASILSCPDNKLNSFALNSTTLTALLSILESNDQCSNSVDKSYKDEILEKQSASSNVKVIYNLSTQNSVVCTLAMSMV